MVSYTHIAHSYLALLGYSVETQVYTLGKEELTWAPPPWLPHLGVFCTCQHPLPMGAPHMGIFPPGHSHLGIFHPGLTLVLSPDSFVAGAWPLPFEPQASLMWG